MSRARYVVAYDIRDPVRLRRVHEVCKTFGEPLQYSVFLCDLDGRELLACRAALREEMNLHHDSVVIVDLGQADGRGADCFEFIGYRGQPLPRSGPTIL
jgi:CRISPR-associated protein Cas2